MITVEQIQVALDAIKAENRLLRRLVEQRKQHKQRLLEGEYKSYERPTFAVPGLDEVLDGVEDEAEEWMATYNL